MTRAIHRFDKHIILRSIDMLIVVGHVPTLVPEMSLIELRASDFLISASSDDITNVILNYSVKHPALWVPKNATSGVFLKMKEIELSTDYPMIIVKRSDIASSLCLITC